MNINNQLGVSETSTPVNFNVGQNFYSTSQYRSDSFTRGKDYIRICWGPEIKCGKGDWVAIYNHCPNDDDVNFLERAYVDDHVNGYYDTSCELNPDSTPQYWIGYFDSQNKLITYQSVAQEFSGPNWMEACKDLFKGRTLSEMIIPGTHDSGAYNMDANSKNTPDAEDWVKILSSLTIPALDEAIATWARAQGYSILGQLNAGIRDFDFRVWRDSEGQYWLIHAKASVLVSTVLDDIATFMEQNKGEVVFASFNHFYDMPDHDQHVDLLNLIHLKTCTWLAPTNLSTKPLYEQLVNNNQRLFIEYWNGNDQAVDDSSQVYFGKIWKSFGALRNYDSSAVKTPDFPTIYKYGSKGSLASLANDTNPPYTTRLMQDVGRIRTTNVFRTDWFQTCAPFAAQMARTLNKFKFNDLLFKPFIGFDKEEYYKTIQVNVVGNKMYFLGRDSAGIILWQYDRNAKTWHYLEPGPAWSDSTTGGESWEKEKFYSTIQSVTVDNQIYLLARCGSGMIMHKYDCNTGIWHDLGNGPAWGDSTTGGESWENKRFYSTIQSVAVGNQIYLLARCGSGMIMYKYDCNAGTWHDLGNGPAWGDSTTGGESWEKEKFYLTIQSVAVGNQIHLLARCSSGIIMHKYDCNAGTWHDLGNGPAWSDSSSGKGWENKRFYSTIQSVAVGNQIYLLARCGSGIIMHKYDCNTGTWHDLGNGPGWDDGSGWGKEEYNSTIQSVTDGNQIYLLARCSDGVIIHKYDCNTGTWHDLGNGPGWSDKTHWNNPSYYSTIKAIVVSDSQPKLYVFGNDFNQGAILNLHNSPSLALNSLPRENNINSKRYSGSFFKESSDLSKPMDASNVEIVHSMNNIDYSQKL